MKSLFCGAGVQNKKLNRAVHNFCESSSACASSQGPHRKKKISKYNKNEAFSEEKQADFLTAKLGGENFEIMNKVQLGTEYAE